MGDVKLQLLYRASLHGWYYKDFHYYCDNRGATVTFFQIQNGDCVAGYTLESWNS